MGTCCSQNQFDEARVIRHATHSVYVEEVFEFMTVIGEGSYGVVRKARRLNSSELVAVKSINKAKVTGHLEELRTEVGIMLEVDHPNIVRYYHTYEDPECIHIVMELVTGGELFHKLRQAKVFDEDQTRKYMRQMLMAIASLHSNKIVHRDLKPENFLVDAFDESLKLIDFGLSAKFTRGQFSEQVGTVHYVAPEVIAADYNYKCDLWSLGVLMYTMLTGHLPFTGADQDEVISNIQKGQYSVSRLQQSSQEACDLIMKLIVVNPKRRLDAVEALSHEWFQLQPRYHSQLNPSVLDSLQKYRTASLFEKEAMSAVVRQLPSEKMTRITQAYAAVDPKGAGRINFGSFEGRVAEQGYALESQEIQEIAQAIDLGRNGKIKYSDFLAAACFSRFGTDEGQIQAAFHYFDVENTGVITEDNLRRSFERLNVTVSQQAIEEMIESLQIGPEGMNYSQFKTVLLTSQRTNVTEEVERKLS